MTPQQLVDQIFVDLDTQGLPSMYAEQAQKLLSGLVHDSMTVLSSGQDCRDHIYNHKITQLHYICRYPNVAEASTRIPSDEFFWFVLPAHLPYRQTLQPVIERIQEDNRSNRPLISPLVISLLKYCDEWSKAVEVYVLSGRKWSVDIQEDEIPLASIHEMQVFYECGRKHVYKSEEEALLHREGQNNVYSCSWCGNWHQGRPSKGTTTHSVQLTRWMSVWKREHFKKLSRERNRNLQVSE